MKEKFRLVPVFNRTTLEKPDDPRRYKVETTRLLTVKEAKELMAELGSPYVEVKK